jgi:hypothetical protein
MMGEKYELLMCPKCGCPIAMFAPHECPDQPPEEKRFTIKLDETIILFKVVWDSYSGYRFSNNEPIIPPPF